MPKKRKPEGESLISGFRRRLSGAGPARDLKILEAELKAHGLDEPSFQKAKQKYMKTKKK